MNSLIRLLTMFSLLCALMVCTGARELAAADVASVHPTGPPDTGQVIGIRSMTTSRAAHTATCLRNGKVLITGGFDSKGRGLSSAEIFDPDSRTFVPTGSMNVARHSHTASLLPDGKVLIAGGYNGDYLDSAELYDPGTGKFTPTGPLTLARHGHVGVLLNNGKVLIAGGVGIGWTFLATTELYNPTTGAFTVTASMTIPRESHTATLLKNGKVLITGGHKDRHAAITIYSEAELYEPVTSTFAGTGKMTTRRHKHDATSLPDGKVLISGGADERDDRGTYASTEIYNPESGVFTAAASMHAARYKHKGTSVLLKNAKILLIGGASLTEVYDPATNRFSEVARSTGTTRLFAASALLSNSEVLLTGGYGTDIAASAQAWVFMP